MACDRELSVYTHSDCRDFAAVRQRCYDAGNMTHLFRYRSVVGVLDLLQEKRLFNVIAPLNDGLLEYSIVF